VVGQRKGPSGANAPPVHGIKKCLETSGRNSCHAQLEKIYCFTYKFHTASRLVNLTYKNSKILLFTSYEIYNGTM
jgi:hypothetical protein